ncbi:MAG: ATP-dependent protease LonB [Oscillospiraceae bacterium]|jgi:Lon-like ATP-dependent protease|nr:ATP-dependent protease LonB [Oscillospiraceae bacterium]
MIGTVLLVIQLAVTGVIGVYFFTQLRNQRKAQPAAKREGSKEMDKLLKMRGIHLSEPLSERVRPVKFEDIIGQQEGVKALKVLLHGPNPQHVIIYGPPGVGKTCAARLALESAKQSLSTPFRPDAPFIEMDATCVRFDERAIADPLLGSVHDPIYQGAGPLGVQGIPQPKPGAVTRAHGGVLFLDEIGELHPTQMNKLLKVLEDRKVSFESAYYNPEDTTTPRYIHEIFKKGMPADFRLIGATTRGPENLPPALRSRCMEIYFRALEPDEVSKIAAGAAKRAGYDMGEEQADLVGRYASCGRDAVNIVQMAAGLAQLEHRMTIMSSDIEWVADSSHFQPRPDQTARSVPEVGCVHGLAVYGSHQGAVMEIEAVAVPGMGKVTVTGIVEEEELGGDGHRMRRKSTARGSAENVATLLRRLGYGGPMTDLHINFPGGQPVDGPSAGVAMAVAACSALTGVEADGATALTGEVTVRGEVKPVGGVPAKIEAARRAGLKRVLIPRANWQSRFKDMGIEVRPVDTLVEAIGFMLVDAGSAPITSDKILPLEPLAARAAD